MLFPIKLPSSKWMSILLSVSITLSSLVLSSPIPAGSSGIPDLNVDTREAYSREMIDDYTVVHIMPYVIPVEVGLNLCDLKTPPTYRMSLATLVCHWQALENLRLFNGPVKDMWFSVPWVEHLQNQYTDWIMFVMQASDFGNGAVGDLGEASLPQAPPTKEQLRYWVVLLHERRYALAHPETLESQFMVDNLARMIRQLASSNTDKTVWIDDLTLRRMMPYVIPEGIPVIFDDLMKWPSKEMSLETLKLHLEALNNLNMQYLPFRLEHFDNFRVEHLQNQYTDWIMSVMQASDFGNEAVGDLGEASLPQAPLTKEKLLRGIWLLRERRSQLAQRTLEGECDKLDSIIKIRLSSSECEPGMSLDKIWPDFILVSMLPRVIPKEVGLTFDDLMAKPTAGMDLEMLAYHWEALENLQLWECRESSFHVPRLDKLQRQYTSRIKAIAGTEAFDQQGPFGRDRLMVEHLLDLYMARI
ncbi:hypothetical protein SeLEV6574_g08447, partial [Synchytrium endobioticum]